MLETKRFCKTLFFSMDRGSDLGYVRTAEIMRFPKDDGFFLTMFGARLYEIIIIIIKNNIIIIIRTFPECFAPEKFQCKIT